MGDTWSEDYGLMPRIDACLLGAGMYPGYEQYWTALRNEPDTPAWVTGAAPTPAELEWARFSAQIPHYVLSSTLTSTLWPNTSFLRGLEDIAALKQRPGKDIYLVGGGRTTASLIDAGLVDELRLIAYPLIAGEGQGALCDGGPPSRARAAQCPATARRPRESGLHTARLKASLHERRFPMKVVRLKAPASVANLRVLEEDPPEPKAGEVLVRLRAGSLNPHDDFVVRGIIPAADGRIPLSDGAGEVLACGEGVTELRVGDAVVSTFWPYWLSGEMTAATRREIPGETVDGYAREYACMPAHAFTRAPAGL